MRTNATQFLQVRDALNELDRIKFAVIAMVEFTDQGSFAKENAANAAAGIKSRIDYLHDCFSKLLPRVSD